MDIQVIDRNEEILDPSLDIVSKCGKMARICYRVDKDTGHDTDVRIVQMLRFLLGSMILQRKRHGLLRSGIRKEIADALHRKCFRVAT